MCVHACGCKFRVCPNCTYRPLEGSNMGSFPNNTRIKSITMARLPSNNIRSVVKILNKSKDFYLIPPKLNYLNKIANTPPKIKKHNSQMGTSNERNTWCPNIRSVFAFSTVERDSIIPRPLYEDDPLAESVDLLDNLT